MANSVDHRESSYFLYDVDVIDELTFYFNEQFFGGKITETRRIEWSDLLTERLVDMWQDRSNQCLWDTKAACYHDRTLRRLALTKITEDLKFSGRARLFKPFALLI